MIREGKLSDLLTLVRGWCEENVTAEDVDEAEEIAMTVAQAVGHVVVEQGIRQTAGKASYERSSRSCVCGRRAGFKEYRGRSLGTMFGKVEVERAYYYCRHCHTGQLPWDAQQGLDNRLWTPRVKSLVCQISARLSYKETVELLAETTGIVLEESSAELIVGDVGERVRAAESEKMEAYAEEGVMALVAEAPERLYISMDGSMAHIDRSWHEVKTGVVYEGKCGEDGLDESGEKHYLSAREPAQQFAKRLNVAAAQAGMEGADEVVVIGDGAPWIWNLADRDYSAATQIVDLWHAKQHVWNLAEAQYGEESPQGKRWARYQCQRLEEEGPDPLLRALARMKPRTKRVAQRLRREQGYFTRNAHRMRYPQFRERGLMIGSGPVEAGCKLVVGQRLKRPGMRWKQQGAGAILALRCLVLNGQHDDIRRFARAA